MTDSSMSGAVTIITGGSGGIGRSIAKLFLDSGSKVVLMGRSQERLEEAAAGLDVTDGSLLLFSGDVSLAADCHAVVNETMGKWGRIDSLVNSAAIDDEADFLEMTEEGWDAVMDVNLKGPYLLSQAVAKVMVDQGGGSIVHISSIDHQGADGLYTSYNVSKAGLMGLSRCMAVELARYGIRSNVVSPGATKTEMIERVMGAELMDYMENRFDRVPMKRMVLPEEVAAACLFFASKASSAITGVDLIVDCGTSANLYIVETMPKAAEVVGAS
jgi:meso-butanediol dehydrogenase / (S,S)-butanediol dehydrogenase / diacetyl reductase